jgi:uncharacterized protein YxeA
MDFNKDSILYIIIAITVIAIGYILYVLYTDQIECRADNTKLSIKLLELVQKVENTTQDLETFKTQITETEGESEGELESDVESEGELESDVESEGNLEGEDFNVFDQFLMNPEQLKQLQQLQNEIKGSSGRLEPIAEGEEGKTDTEEGEETEAGSDTETEGDFEGETEVEGESDTEINFVKPGVEKYCSSVLKSGPNKGKTCSKPVLGNSELCKLHTKA